MKKIKFNNKFLIIIASAAVVIALVVVAVASMTKTNRYKLALDNLSEARFYMKQDATEKLNVQFFTGMREEPYEMNGITNKTTAFGIINVDPKDPSLANYIELKGTLKIGEELVEVTLDKNPYDKNFACDIGRLVEADKNLVFVLQLNDDTISFNLKPCMPDNAITWERALEIATEYLSEKIESAGKFECYIKIIHDLVKNTGGFWYIQFVPEQGKTFFCVIDPSGKIVG